MEALSVFWTSLLSILLAAFHQGEGGALVLSGDFTLEATTEKGGEAITRVYRHRGASPARFVLPPSSRSGAVRYSFSGTLRLTNGEGTQQAGAADSSTFDIARPKVRGLSSLVRLVDGFHDEGLFQGGVALARGTETLLEGVWGNAGPDGSRALLPGDRFPIGSITKAVTATLILDLVEDGVLALDAPLKECLPAYRRDHSERLTLRHLLDHTSGIPYVPIDHYGNETDLEELSSAELLAYLNREAGPLDWEPGSEFRYCNTGYRLLAMVAEEATGRSFEELLSDRVLGPLGMLETFPTRGPVGAGQASDFVSGARAHGFGLHRNPVPARDLSIHRGAGNLASTIQDMLSFGRGMLRGAVIDEGSREAMWTPGPGGYGLGWKVEELELAGRSVRVVGHSGGFKGFSSHLAFVPEHDLVAVVLANSDLAPAAVLVNELLAASLGESVPSPPVQRSVAAGLAREDAIHREERLGDLRAGLARAKMPAHDFGAARAAGPPDADRYATEGAWVPAVGCELEWLAARFPSRRPATRLVLHGFALPHRVIAIEVRSDSGTTVHRPPFGWERESPTTLAVHELALDAEVIEEVVLHIDDSKGNCGLDAIGLSEAQGDDVVWAEDVRVSSSLLGEYARHLDPHGRIEQQAFEIAAEELQEQGEPEAAEALLRSCVELFDYGLRAQLMLARWCLRNGHLAEANELFEVVMNGVPELRARIAKEVAGGENR